MLHILKYNGNGGQKYPQCIAKMLILQVFQKYPPESDSGIGL